MPSMFIHILREGMVHSLALVTNCPKKRRRQWGLVQCGHFADKGEGGYLDVDVRTFWYK